MVRKAGIIAALQWARESKDFMKAVRKIAEILR
jgi:hypothetical protein